MKGILLAGGTGSRLYPMTMAVSKQLLPVYDKPMIYYPLSTLMLAGIREVLVITRPSDRVLFERQLGDGSQWGLQLAYAEQPRAEGIAQAFLIAEEFIGIDGCALALGDNIFYGPSLSTRLRDAAGRGDATIFAIEVQEPQRYGVIEFDANRRPVSLEEKPSSPKSRWAVTGLYFYDGDVVDIVKHLKPSNRGELEITHVNQSYLASGRLRVEQLEGGCTWFDAGTVDSLHEAGDFMRALERRHGRSVACLEEIAYDLGYIGVDQIRAAADACKNSAYGVYLTSLLEPDAK